MSPLLRPILLLAAGILTTVHHVHAQSRPSPGTLLQFDFNDAVTWPVTSRKPGEPGVRAGKFGTVDIAGSKEASGGLLLVKDQRDQSGWIYGKSGWFHRNEAPIQAGGAKRPWTLALTSGPLAVANTETNLGKLTFSFSLSASSALPVRVSIESFDAQQKRTGGLETTIRPAAADFYQRYALDLSMLEPAGDGTFDPLAPFVSFTLVIGSAAGWPAAAYHEVRLDNVHYAKAALYVSPQGSDTNDGRTEKTAFATPQKAVDAAQPGDIIVLMNGTYAQPAGTRERTPLAKFTRPGVPAGWITLKNYPGHKPVLSTHGQPAISIVQVKDQPTLAYLEMRGLNVRGNGDTAREQFPAEIGKATPNTDVQGIIINGRITRHPGKRTENEMVHHIRLADNVVEFCTSDGIYAEYCDWLFLEKNRIENNCWTTVGYAPSGFSLMGYANFDALDNVPKILIAGNRVSGNKLTVFNHPRGEKATAFYNGNGILLDDNAGNPSEAYLGRTLVQNNLAHNNGGGGIQMWGSHRLDLINNTIYHNATNLDWGQVGFERCRDVRLINNIIVAPPNRALDTWVTGRMDEQTAGIVRLNNLYSGGAEPNVEGINDLRADPLFVNATADPATADFRLKAGSPALRAGRWELFSPTDDLDGKPRPTRGAPDLGAYQH
jgi:parallel beta-helix repeat protein